MPSASGTVERLESAILRNVRKVERKESAIDIFEGGDNEKSSTPYACSLCSKVARLAFPAGTGL